MKTNPETFSLKAYVDTTNNITYVIGPLDRWKDFVHAALSEAGVKIESTGSFSSLKADGVTYVHRPTLEGVLDSAPAVTLMRGVRRYTAGLIPPPSAPEPEPNVLFEVLGSTDRAGGFMIVLAKFSAPRSTSLRDLRAKAESLIRDRVRPGSTYGLRTALPCQNASVPYYMTIYSMPEQKLVEYVFSLDMDGQPVADVCCRTKFFAPSDATPEELARIGGEAYGKEHNITMSVYNVSCYKILRDGKIVVGPFYWYVFERRSRSV